MPYIYSTKKTFKTTIRTCIGFSINQVHQYNNDQSTQKLYMPDIEFKPVHKLFRVLNSSLKSAENSNTDTIALHVYKNSPKKIIFPIGLLKFCKTNAEIYSTQENIFLKTIIILSINSLQ